MGTSETDHFISLTMTECCFVLILVVVYFEFVLFFAYKKKKVASNDLYLVKIIKTRQSRTLNIATYKNPKSVVLCIRPRLV